MTEAPTKTGAQKRSVQKARAYVVVDVAQGQSQRVASLLRRKPGVVIADVVEAQSSVIMVVEAPNRQALADLAIEALASIEELTVDIHLMPAEEP